MALDDIGPLHLARLEPAHRVDQFDCVRAPALNDWLRERALPNQERRLSSVWVLCCSDGIVRAYFSLSGHVIKPEQLARNDRKNADAGAHAQLLGRFATDRTIKGNGMGVLLMDLVFEKFAEITQVSTTDFLCLDAKNAALVAYYQENFGFKPSHLGAQDDGTTFMYQKTSAVLKRFEQAQSAAGSAQP